MKNLKFGRIEKIIKGSLIKIEIQIMASNAVRSAFKLYVGNLSWTVGSNELRKYFSKFGHVTIANVAFDKNTGLSRNYAFVGFSTREGFENALNNKHKLEGLTLNVQPANSGTNNN